MKYVMSPFFTYCWNCASVTLSSLPLHPPIDMTAVSELRMYPAAL